MAEYSSGAGFFQSADIPVGDPLTIKLALNLSNISISVTTDIVGTGSLDLTVKVAGGPDIVPTLANINIATPLHSVLDSGSFSEITFTPNTIATATTYKVFLQAKR